MRVADSEDTARRVEASVPRDARIGVERPGLDPADDVVQRVEAMRAEILGRVRAAHAVVAEESQWTILRFREQAFQPAVFQRKERFRHRGERAFLGRAHVDEQEFAGANACECGCRRQRMDGVGHGGSVRQHAPALGSAARGAWHHAAMSDDAHALHRVPRHPHAWWWPLLAAHALVFAAWWQAGWRIGLPLLAATHLAFLWGVLRPSSRMYGPVLTRLPVTDRRVVWLTIDDGPSGDTRAILDLLDAHGARATFFLVGERATARPELVREIAARGHGVGNHSQTHPQAWFWALGPARIRREIAQCQQVLRDLTGAAPRWFRAVVGHANPFVSAPLRDHGLARAAWSARGFDAVHSDPAQVVARIERDLAPGAIVLLHEGARHGRNVEMIALLLQRMRASGYGTVLPDDL